MVVVLAVVAVVVVVVNVGLGWGWAMLGWTALCSACGFVVLSSCLCRRCCSCAAYVKARLSLIALSVVVVVMLSLSLGLQSSVGRNQLLFFHLGGASMSAHCSSIPQVKDGLILSGMVCFLCGTFILKCCS